MTMRLAEKLFGSWVKSTPETSDGNMACTVTAVPARPRTSLRLR